MLKVMIIDDEPNIAQGLGVLIDWAAEGFEIVCTATDGKQALSYLLEHTVDLVLLDIQMPVMDGLEMLKAVQEEQLSRASFIILSGYNDFSYAQQALRLGCQDYLLKPVERDGLLSVVRRISNRSQEEREEEEEKKRLEEAYLGRVLVSLLHGRADSQLRQSLPALERLKGDFWYVAAEPQADAEENPEMEGSLQEKLESVLPRDYGLCIQDYSQEKERYELGFLLSETALERTGQTLPAFLSSLQRSLAAKLPEDIRLLAGKRVSTLEALSKSYSSCQILRSMTSFREGKSVYLYEEELQVRGSTIALQKDLIEKILDAVRNGEKESISPLVDELYQELANAGLNSDSYKLNINYLLFQLVHLASAYDDEVDQSYIAGRISDSSLGEGSRGGKSHLLAFLLEYSDYLLQLKGHLSGGVLLSVEKEIRENYAGNLTLKDLGNRYFLNSSYLGQIFRKKYGLSFRDYLNQVRIAAATDLLVNTEKKIAVIAEEIGYRDRDYFIRKFIELKGCTPTKYRREHSPGNKRE